MAEETLVDDSDSSGAFIIRLIDILHSIISSGAIYLHAFLKILQVLTNI